MQQGCSEEKIAQIIKIQSSPHERLSKIAPGKAKLPVSPVKMLVGRECNYSGRGRFSSADACHLLNKYIPIKGPSIMDIMERCIHVSQFSADGSFFFAGCEEGLIRIYNVDLDWLIHEDIEARSLRCRLTDASLSPDRHFLEIHEALEFSSYDEDYSDDGFGILSVKFSTDGRELLAGSTEGSLCVYDLQEKRLNYKFHAHSSAVNTVCFAYESGRIVYSGSKDLLCKVWDRRCLGDRRKAAGVLMGHLEEITHIDTRGDSRYFISNGKDHCIKLWDVRKMSSNLNYTSKRRDSKQAKNSRHPDDLSVVTYKGHSAFRSVIRSYFSPVYSTGQKYIYTGSSDNSAYIYDVISGKQVKKLDFHEDLVPDCNWHPYYPIFVSSSWDGSLGLWEFPERDPDTEGESN